MQIGPPPAARAPEKLPDQPPAAPRQFDRGEQKLQLRIDPQTGKPVPKFDPETSEPIGKFDPETGFFRAEIST